LQRLKLKKCFSENRNQKKKILVAAVSFKRNGVAQITPKRSLYNPETRHASDQTPRKAFDFCAPITKIINEEKIFKR
jgi:hypothetical protein